LILKLLILFQATAPPFGQTTFLRRKGEAMTELSHLQGKIETENHRVIQAYAQIDKIIEILKARGRGDDPGNLLNEIAKVLGLPALGVAGMTNDFKISHTRGKTPPHEQPDLCMEFLMTSGEQGFAIGGSETLLSTKRSSAD
jgi:hypothetical protein